MTYNEFIEAARTAELDLITHQNLASMKTFSQFLEELFGQCSADEKVSKISAFFNESFQTELPDDLIIYVEWPAIKPCTFGYGYEPEFPNLRNFLSQYISKSLIDETIGYLFNTGEYDITVNGHRQTYEYQWVDLYSIYIELRNVNFL